MQRLCLVCPPTHGISSQRVKLSFPIRGSSCDPQSRASQLNASDRPLKGNSFAVAMFMRRTFDFVLRTNTSGLRRPMLLCRLANSSWST